MAMGNNGRFGLSNPKVRAKLSPEGWEFGMTSGLIRGAHKQALIDQVIAATRGMDWTLHANREDGEKRVRTEPTAAVKAAVDAFNPSDWRVVSVEVDAVSMQVRARAYEGEVEGKTWRVVIGYAQKVMTTFEVLEGYQGGLDLRATDKKSVSREFIQALNSVFA